MGFYNIIYILKCFLSKKVKLFIVALLLVVSLLFLLNNKSNAEDITLTTFEYKGNIYKCDIPENVNTFLTNSIEYLSGEYKYIYFANGENIIQFINKDSNCYIDINFLIGRMDFGFSTFTFKNIYSNDSFIYYILDDNGDVLEIGNSLYNGELQFWTSLDSCSFNSTIDMYYNNELFYGSPSMYQTVQALTRYTSFDNLFLGLTLCLPFLAIVILFILGIYLIRKTQGGIK